MKYVVFFLMVVCWQLNAQQSTIKIIDSHSKKPLYNANICLESTLGKNKLFISTDSSGSVVLNISYKHTFAVSAIGYETLLDTILPGQRKVLFINPSSYDLNEVVVTGQHSAIKADKSIYKIDIISNAQIREKAANNLSELLSTELNLRISQDGALGSNISLQGLSGEHIKILVDGVPVIGRQGGILDLSQILLSNIDHIEIVEGPMSVIYGSNALAGAINIITKQPKHGKFIGKADLNYETVGIYNAEATISYINKNNSITVSGGRNFFGGFAFSDTSRVKDWKPKEQYFAGFDYGLKGKNSNIKLSFNLFREKLLNAGRLTSSFLTDTIRNNSGDVDTVRFYSAYSAADQYHYTNRMNAKAEYNYNFSIKSVITSTLALSFYNKIKNTLVKDLTTLHEELAGNNAQDTTNSKNIMLRTTYNNSELYWLDFLGGVDCNIETATGKRISGNKRIDDNALYSSFKVLPKSKFNLQLGGRYIYNSRFEAPFIYSVNMRYLVTDNLNIRASFGKGFRAPSLKELFLIFQDISHNIQGNDSLMAEKSKNYSFSTEYTLFPNTNHTFKINCNLFYNKISNKIDFLYDINNPTWAKYYNIQSDHFVSKGAEIMAKYNFHPRFTFSTGINYLARSKTSNLDEFFRSTDFTVDFSYKNLKYLFRISAYYKYTDDWYTSRMELNKTGEKRILDGYMKGYQTLNITVGRPFFKNTIDISLGGKNLFGNTTVTSYGSGQNVHGASGGESPVGWGRSYFVRLTYNFIKY